MNSILVTGATGTIGSAVVSQALEGDWDRIIIYSRDELKQAIMEQSLSRHPHASKLRFFLGDVRDLLRLEMAMVGVTHVIHAAALKRIEKCEADPIEAIKTNIDGTANVINAALRKNVKYVCAVSTDKAHNPCSLYGATKLTMERLVLAANNLSGGKCVFSVVRQGNIFGSRGSVVDIWKNILSLGSKTVPVTDPEATRYFVRSADAAKFILEQGFNDTPGLKCPSDMPAYCIRDLAIAMDVEAFDLKGLSAYEKLHEELSHGINSSMAPRMSVEELSCELQMLTVV